MLYVKYMLYQPEPKGPSGRNGGKRIHYKILKRNTAAMGMGGDIRHRVRLGRERCRSVSQGDLLRGVVLFPHRGQLGQWEICGQRPDDHRAGPRDSDDRHAYSRRLGFGKKRLAEIQPFHDRLRGMGYLLLYLALGNGRLARKSHDLGHSFPDTPPVGGSGDNPCVDSPCHGRCWIPHHLL